MKNRAGWLALLVLVIATLLMVFFVIPRISEPEQEAEAPTVPPIETTISDGSAALEKMNRLTSTATSSVEGLSALFADGKTPTAEAFAAARGTAESAISALAALDIPDALDTAIKEQMTTVRGYAEKTLALLQALPTDPQQAASAIAAIANALKGEEAPAPTTAAPEAAVSETPPSAETAGPVMPKFDVLRVEPDGSTVIAGNAAPGAKIEVLSGENVIASVEAGPSGDFAAVLDNPLPPGDHALALRSTGADGTPVVSDEVASVSVPSSPGGELLAMVTKPGEPSRIVTMPETVNEADKQARVAAADQPTTTLPELPAASSLLTTAPPIGGGTQTATEATPAAQPSTDKIQVTAVEIEDERIFIAGTASSGGTVRASVDDQPVGDAAIDGAGNFVVEGKLAIAVGEHTVRVELLDAQGKVVVAASVPFNRPEGSQVAVVAPPANTADDAIMPLESSAFETQRQTLAKAFGILQSLFANGGQPSMEDVAAARSATEIALGALADFRLPGSASSEITDAVGKTSAAARAALGTLQGVRRDVEAIREALPNIASLVDAVLKAAPPLPQASPVAQQPADAAAPAQAAVADTSSTTINQAPLEESANSVIIRRGDTLWQISRRVYGQGVRYTTIYLANEEQIINPDLIEPGQIFKVPSDALPNAEELHRKRLQGKPLD